MFRRQNPQWWNTVPAGLTPVLPRDQPEGEAAQADLVVNAIA